MPGSEIGLHRDYVDRLPTRSRKGYGENDGPRWSPTDPPKIRSTPLFSRADTSNSAPSIRLISVSARDLANRYSRVLVPFV